MIDGLVSIIMPAYNCEQTIEKSIVSVLAQTYTDWELIIVNDCSNDHTQDVLTKYENDQRIIVKCNSQNSRAAITRNNALDLAKGRYIAFLDSDDVWVPEKLEKQLKFMQDQSKGFTFTAYDNIDENDQPINRVIHVPLQISAFELLGNTIIGCSTVLTDRKIVGDYRFITNNAREDMFTWHLILKKGFSAYGMDEILTHYRVSSNSSSGNKYKMAKEYWKGLRDVAGLQFFKRGCYFIRYAVNAVKKRV